MAVCVGVMILSVFYSALGAVKDRLSPSRSIKINGFLNKTDRVTVYLNRGETLRDVRFIGFTDPSSFKGNVPYHLMNMVILESQAGERILLKADSIRSIRQLSAEPTLAATDSPAAPSGLD